MEECPNTVQIKKNNWIKIQPQYLLPIYAGMLKLKSHHEFPAAETGEETKIHPCHATLCINRQPIKFPYFPSLCRQLLSPFPLQRWDINKWS